MDYKLTDFLPTTKKECELRGWDELDVTGVELLAVFDHDVTVDGEAVRTDNLAVVADDEGRGTGLFLSDEPKAIFSKNPIHYGGILDKNGKKIARISPELNAIPGWLEDREQMFHDGILYDYFKDNIKELYIKQTNDFAGGRGLVEL